MQPPSLLLRPSRWARGLLATLHVLALGVATLLPMVWWLPALLLIAASWWLARRAKLPLRLSALPDGLVRLAWPDGRSEDATLQPSSRVTGWLMVLHLHIEGRRLAVPLWPDSSDAELLRQWRVWLRWHWPALQRNNPMGSEK